MKTLVASLGLLFICSGCGSNIPKNYPGPELNTQRVTLNIPIIPSNWICTDDGGGYYTWYDPNGFNTLNSGKALHRQKQVKYDKTGKIEKEEDYYVNSIKVEQFGADPGELSNQQILIEYNYVNQTKGIEPWDCRSNWPTVPKASGRLTLSEAEEIIESWGIKRK